jgi:hypothetical protein
MFICMYTYVFLILFAHTGLHRAAFRVPHAPGGKKRVYVYECMYV